jgi:glutathione S-transferase
MTLIVHHLNNSRSQRILWLLEHLGADYAITHHHRDAVTNLAPLELLAVHPLGKSPVIEHNGRIVSESGAIVEYICAHYGGNALVPDRSGQDYTRYLELMHFAEGSAMTPILLNIYIGRLGEGAAPLKPRIDEQLESHFAYMESLLSEAGFFVGETLTAADFMMSFPAEVAVMQGLAQDKPKLTRFVEWMHAQPAWQRAREKGGAYFGF